MLSDKHLQWDVLSVICIKKHLPGDKVVPTLLLDVIGDLDGT